MNICLGIAATVLTWLVGLPHPFLWGMLTAVLSFIPYLGAAIVVATLFVVGLLVLSTLSQAVIAPLAYIGINAGSLRIKDARDALKIPHNSMNALMQYLKRKLLVQKTGPALDAPYCLTDKGYEVLAEITRRHAA